jgi:hypothetical protein
MNGPYEGEVAVVPGTLRGYRFWRFDNQSLELFPMHINLGPWVRGTNLAFCASDDSLADDVPGVDAAGSPMHHQWDWEKFPAPQADCSCGIYATYDPKVYRTHRPRFWLDYGPDSPSRIVHGSIKASGRMLLGARGFRAARAEVEALWGWRARVAANIYDVPWFRTKRSFLKAYPPHNLSGLLEEK